MAMTNSLMSTFKKFVAQPHAHTTEMVGGFQLQAQEASKEWHVE